MATPPMNDGDKPVTQAQLVAELKATRADLRQEIAGVRTELVGAIHHLVETFGNRFDQMRDEMAAMRSDMAAMRNDMVTMHADLSRQIAGAARAAAEENRREIGIVDDKYRDLPPRVTALERELDEHRRDTTLHPHRRKT